MASVSPESVQDIQRKIDDVLCAINCVDVLNDHGPVKVSGVPVGGPYCVRFRIYTREVPNITATPMHVALSKANARFTSNYVAPNLQRYSYVVDDLATLDIALNTTLDFILVMVQLKLTLNKIQIEVSPRDLMPMTIFHVGGPKKSGTVLDLILSAKAFDAHQLWLDDAWRSHDNQ